MLGAQFLAILSASFSHSAEYGLILLMIVSLLKLVAGTGLEPVRPFGQQILPATIAFATIGYSFRCARRRSKPRNYGHIAVL